MPAGGRRAGPTHQDSGEQGEDLGEDDAVAPSAGTAPAGGSQSQSPTRAADTSSSASSQADGGSAGHPRRRGHSGTQQRLRSYVNPKAVDNDEREPDDDIVSAIDAAGVQRVLEFERAEGRDPIEMPHHHPGYDIESRLDGELERYIEVKSTGDAWGDRGVGLSSYQFETAQRHRDRYWLYVVDRADDDDDFEIHRIQDPASKIGQYLFDSAWAAIGEQYGVPAIRTWATGERTGDRVWVPVRRLTSSPLANQADERWVPVDLPDGLGDLYAVQVLGRVLEPDLPQGALALVAPLGALTPQAGAVTVVELWGQDDPETGTLTTVREWWPACDEESGEIVGLELRGSAQSDVPAFEIAPGHAEPVGRVVAVLAASSAEGRDGPLVATPLKPR